jgi:hypothetical protein
MSCRNARRDGFNARTRRLAPVELGAVFREDRIVPHGAILDEAHSDEASILLRFA